MSEQNVASLVKAVNDLLEAGEPINVSTDDHTGYTGYKPQYIVDAMNEVFGYGCWGFEELSSEIITTQTDKATSMLAIAQVKVWLKGVDFQPAAWGQSRVTRGDIGDAKKGAQTDALKKALSYLSIGNRAYYGLLSDCTADAKLEYIKVGVKAAGLARNLQEWQAFKKSAIGRDIADDKLTTGQLAQLNNKLVQSRKAA